MIQKTADAFLQETAFCDFKHPAIQALSEIIFRGKHTDKEKAVAAFYWVRDNVLYSLGNWNKTASQTLKEKRGTCTNKANLLIALLRSAGISSGYRVLRVQGQEYFGPVAPPRLVRRIGKRSTHIYAAVRLGEHWYECDPSDDITLSQMTSTLNPQSRLVEWNGDAHATLNLDPNHIYEDRGLLENIDHLMQKRQRRKRFIAVKLGNLYLKFLRENGSTVKKAHDLEHYFMRWLKKNHIFHYALLHLDSLWHNIELFIKRILLKS